MSSDTHLRSQFASPNAIPPRTSSHGVINHRKSLSQVLRPLPEVDWMSQSRKSKMSASPEVPLRSSSSASHPESQAMGSQAQAQLQAETLPQVHSQAEVPQAASSPPPPPAQPDNTHTIDLSDELVHGHHARWTEEKERILLGPYDYLVGHPGKDIRSQCIAAFNRWLRVPAERLEIITRVVGMLHTASLLVDDVEDNSVLRRGIPVANSIFGVAQTINTANYVYFEALQELLTMGNPKLIEIFTEELLNLHRGQGMELHWRDSLTCPTEDEYLEMVDNKTGGLFRLAIKLMQAESKVDVDCAPLVSTIGLLFQILDDHLNLCPPELPPSSPTATAAATTTSSTMTPGPTTSAHPQPAHQTQTAVQAGKGTLAEDLTEGKFSFPIIHAIRSDPTNRVLYNILKQKTTDEQVKRFAVGVMVRSGSFAYSGRVVEGLRGRAEALIARCEGEVGGVDGNEGAAGLRGMLRRLALG